MRSNRLCLAKRNVAHY